MIWFSKNGLTTFWPDAGKSALCTALALFAFHFFVDSEFLLGIVFAVPLAAVLVPLAIFALVVILVFLSRRPGWLCGLTFALATGAALSQLLRA